MIQFNLICNGNETKSESKNKCVHLRCIQLQASLTTITIIHFVYIILLDTNELVRRFARFLNPLGLKHLNVSKSINTFLNYCGCIEYTN